MNARKIAAAKTNTAALSRGISIMQAQLPYTTGAARAQLLDRISKARRAHAVSAPR